MTRYRFLDGLGDVVAEQEFDSHVAALARARDGEETDQSDDNEDDDTGDIQRVEFLGPDGDWRWAGPLEG